MSLEFGNSNCAALSYAGTLQAELRYDPLGRLYYLRDYVGPNGITRFAYDGDAMIAEYNNATTLLRRYVHGSNAEADDPLVWYEGTSVAAANARHLHADPRGSIVLVAGSAGQTLAINTYDEYGIPDNSSGTSTDIATKGRFRYTGQAWLPELGMYHYKARVYSPTLGRFLQTDPIGYEDQYNLYTYVGNDPVNAVDPTGRKGSETRLVREERLNLYDKDGKINTRGVTKKIKQLNSEIKRRTVDSGFDREYGVIVTVDLKEKSVVFAVLEGPDKLFRAGTLDVNSYLQGLTENHRFVYGSHTHTGLAVQGEGGPRSTVSALSERRMPIGEGPSTGEKSDETSSKYYKSRRPYVRFHVFYQKLDDTSSPRKWYTEEF